MKIISWNVRGLGNTRTFLALKDILREHKPQILFVCEMKMKHVQMKNMGKTLGFENCFKVGRIRMGAVWLCYGTMKLMSILYRTATII